MACDLQFLSSIPKDCQRSTHISGVPTKARAKTKDQKEQRQRKPCSTRAETPLIAIILQREDDKHQDRARNKLAKELTRFRQVCLRIRAKDSSSGIHSRRYGADAGAAFEGVDAVDVVGVYHAGRDKAT